MYYPNQSYLNPYMQQNLQYVAQTQQPQYPSYQMQTPQQMINLNGKIVNRIEDISVQEIPMDGTNAFFPISDGTKIVVKKWNSNGTISTTEYLQTPVESAIEETKEIDFRPITERLDGIEEMLNKLTQYNNKIPAKKDVTKNE